MTNKKLIKLIRQCPYLEEKEKYSCETILKKELPPDQIRVAKELVLRLIKEAKTRHELVQKNEMLEKKIDKLKKQERPN